MKTPTRTQFEHPEFPCGDKVGLAPKSGGDVTLNVSGERRGQAQPPPGGNRLRVRDGFHDDGQWHIGKQNYALRRRRSSDKGNCGPMPWKKRYNGPSGGGGGRHFKKSILPTKFLLGGSITDPLNLNSMNDEQINRMLNERTPQSSPLPAVALRYQHVQVLVPPNIADPLNLNTGEDLDISLISPRVASKKKRHKRKKSLLNESAHAEEKPGENSDFSAAGAASVQTDATPIAAACVASVVLNTPSKRDINKIVSPVIPQMSPKRRRKRTSSEHRADPNDPSSVSDSDRPAKTKHQSPHGARPRLPSVNRRRPPPPAVAKSPRAKQRSRQRFIYGNYNRYYGYRNPAQEEDRRLKCLKRSWIDGKDVLDIGCNVGHVTLAVARDWHPRRIVGVDIDGKLIQVARRNIRYYLSSLVADANAFPISMPLTYGPIAAPPVRGTNAAQGFPHNIVFVEVVSCLRLQYFVSSHEYNEYLFIFILLFYTVF